MAGTRHHRPRPRAQALVPRAGEWQFNKWRFVGTSIAGVRTSIYAPDFDVCFDVAQGLPFATSSNRFLITHGHMDHAAGIPYLISQKAMYHHKKPTFYMPPSMVEPLHEIIRIWQKIEGHHYEYDFIGVEIGQEYELNRDVLFKPFRTVHRVESNGYTIYRRQKRLRDEFRGLAHNKLVELRAQKIEIETHELEPLISFTGDTQIEYLQNNPDVLRSKVLFTEVTYVDERKTVQAAREWGHLHLDELLPLLPQLHNEKIVVIHLSSRYQIPEVESLLNEKVPAEFRDRIAIFPSV